MLIDTHAHLYWDSYKEDFDEMIAKAIDAGVSTIINVGVDVEKSQEALDQTKGTKWPTGLTVYSTIGIHPHESVKYTSVESMQKDMDKLEQIYLSDPEKVVAVGECGLDYKDVDEKARKLQKPLFQAQIDLAKKLNLPLVVHCRDCGSTSSPPTKTSSSPAWDETLEMLGNQTAILHCYSGLLHHTQYIIRNTNFYVSFAANITYPKNEYLRKAAKLLPLERILLETDSPFLAPQSKRGQRNEPAAVSEIAQLIADLKGISFEEVAKQTTQNTREILRLRSG